MTRDEAVWLYIDFARIMVQRDRRTYRQEHLMPIEIKGLADGVQRARAAIKAARQATDDMGHSVRRLVDTANQIAEACENHRHDLEFEAQQLGNAPAEGDETFRQPGAGNGATE